MWNYVGPYTRMAELGRAFDLADILVASPPADYSNLLLVTTFLEAETC
jgi:hypothetical protein